jgi:hypothetical protein
MPSMVAMIPYICEAYTLESAMYKVFFIFITHAQIHFPSQSSPKWMRKTHAMGLKEPLHKDQ